MVDALEGVKVLDFTQVVFGPTCTQILGDFGADVIKVEPFGGELARGRGRGPAAFKGERPSWLGRNRNKRSIVVDLKQPEGKEIIYKLVKECDVVVQNFRPGVMERLGLGYEALKKHNPRLIYASGTGYGRTGPYAFKGGQDRAAQAYAGTIDLNGDPDGPPMPVGPPIADIPGGMFLAQGILLALFARERTGEGQEVDVSLLDGQFPLLANEANTYLMTGEPVTRTIRPLYWVYKAKDKYIMLIEYFHPNPLSLICSAMGIEDLSKDPSFDSEARILANFRELRSILAEIFPQKTAAEWIKLFDEKDVICAPVNSVPEALADLQVIHNQMVFEMDHALYGKIKAVANPVKLSRTPTRVRIPPPLVGQHTDEILFQLGYTQQEAEELRSKKAVA